MAKRSYPGMGGGGNMQQLIRQAQKMQEDAARVQAEIEAREMEATVGGGAVKAVMNGKHQLVSITISPEAVDPEDVEMLQDLVVSAVNEALRQIDEMSAAGMGKVTGNLNLPGMPGLF